MSPALTNVKQKHFCTEAGFAITFRSSFTDLLQTATMGSNYRINKPQKPHTRALLRALLLPCGYPQHLKLSWVWFGETISCIPAGCLHTSAVTATKTRCESAQKPLVHLAGTFTDMVCALSSLWELITTALNSHVVSSWHGASKLLSLYRW